MKELRDKLPHRNAPAFSTESNFDINFHMPAVFIIKRAIGKYKQVSMFIAEYAEAILDDYQKLNDISSEELV